MIVPHTAPSDGLTATAYSLTAMRLSLPGCTGSLGSTYAPRLPSPEVSTTNGVQRCDCTSSLVASNFFTSSQPSTAGPTTPALKNSCAWSREKARWWVGKQVETSVNFSDAGSYIAMLRFDCLIGNAFADGCADPALHQSGFSFGRICEVIQTRPFSSIIGLCVIVWLFQIAFGPHDGEKPCGRAVTFGVAGSRTGIFTSLSACVVGSRIGM